MLDSENYAQRKMSDISLITSDAWYWDYIGTNAQENWNKRKQKNVSSWFLLFCCALDGTESVMDGHE
jgi:hypothetical protein